MNQILHHGTINQDVRTGFIAETGNEVHSFAVLQQSDDDLPSTSAIFLTNTVFGRLDGNEIELRLSTTTGVLP